jgi:uncharacterized protein (DUF1330 family)
MVYLVNSYDIIDDDVFKNYPPVVAKLFAKYGAKVLAMETNPKTLEGEPKTMNAIIEFPSEEVIFEMYNDPEYQAVIHFRHESTSDARMVILKPR